MTALQTANVLWDETKQQFDPAVHTQIQTLKSSVVFPSLLKYVNAVNTTKSKCPVVMKCRV